MHHEIIMPALGMNQDHGVIAQWHKKEGDKVETGDIIMEIETDKALMEIEAKHQGYLSEIVCDEGNPVPIGSIVGYISNSIEAQSMNNRLNAQVEPKGGDAQKVKLVKHTDAIQTLTKKIDDNRHNQLEKNVIGLKKDANTKILSSAKAKGLAVKEHLKLSAIKQYSNKDIIHVADVLAYKNHVTLSDKVKEIHDDYTIKATIEVNASEFKSCIDWLSQKEGATQNAAAILTALISANIRKFQLMTNDTKIHIKADYWAGDTLHSNFFTDPDYVSFSQLKSCQFEQIKEQVCQFHVIYFADSDFNQIQLFNVNRPTFIANIYDAKLRIDLLGFYYDQFKTVAQFSKTLKQAIEEPLFYLS
ncbi:biotin/lipoyl-binding protein [Thiotrichales bacterium 19S3-7]|nr:biotin/lipoyl-binding protein [Thiotrichales bacterium 19S3-7]MCF6800657.1 biotin/lipoyl-binding protein [Thiotrichales bacterium 19S3-11]